MLSPICWSLYAKCWAVSLLKTRTLMFDFNMNLLTNFHNGEVLRQALNSSAGVEFGRTGRVSRNYKKQQISSQQMIILSQIPQSPIKGFP
ncbi:hypothetical protein AVEN_44974-1 [Araneus ventricosus]|uniref:Uncharacterized protein n=1 Tax=Araneus ventricosus TaxID=182803 RepID=A0A4Y2WWG3_ARAVE|nr:hypothetical protein AVEN_44974-1 [Araneus ventricosus]